MGTQSNTNISFDLHSLGWKSFQDLCFYIGKSILGQQLQVFSDSNDGGRDGAFKGNWKVNDSETLTGSFTIQCKHTCKRDKSIRLSDISAELEKAHKLAKQGVCDNYILITNFSVSAVVALNIINAFTEIDGIVECRVFGREWITKQIIESKKLRSFVPRVYGIGDLSQIIDERKYEQAQAVLELLKDDLDKFVITDSYEKSVKALEEHSFVMLLGEPASGKSTIARALCMATIDRWDCRVMKVDSANEFNEHWNPKEHKQVFWVDDVFGATQLEADKAVEWNRKFIQINAAIRTGAKFIFTSRGYIYKGAKQYIKEESIVENKESKVVIEVNDISKENKEQILYNHIKLGNQSENFRAKVKDFLPSVIESNYFSPAGARRLGNETFTKELKLTKNGVLSFFEKPKDFLVGTIERLDNTAQAVIALLFINQGKIESPINITNNQSVLLERMGADVKKIVSVFSVLEGSFVKLETKDEKKYWQYKHPTVHDAYAEIIANSPEYLDIYMEGASAAVIMKEASFGKEIEGAKVVVPSNKYELFVNKIIQEKYITGRPAVMFNSPRSNLNYFLYSKCGKGFLQLFLTKVPRYLASLRLSTNSFFGENNLLLRLNEEELLTTADKNSLYQHLLENTLSTGDCDIISIISGKEAKLFSAEQLNELKAQVEELIVPDLSDALSELENDYDADYEPNDYLYDFENYILSGYKDIFPDSFNTIDKVDKELQFVKDRLQEIYDDKLEPDEDTLGERGGNLHNEDGSAIGRSVFDDLDS